VAAGLAAPRPGLLVRGAHVVSMDEARSEFSPGYVAVRDDVIVGVGPLRDCPSAADQVIDAAGQVVIPGFVNAHTHAIHILMRGGLSDDRPLYDWLFNVILPGLAVYGQAEVELAARFYCAEALLSGITTFVDNVEFPVDRFDMAADAAIGVYRDMGPRVIYARMFYDYTPPDFVPLIDAAQAREPGVRHDPGGFETAASALASIESLIRRHHGSADGRIQVWPSPGVAILCSREGLLGAKDLARRRGTRLTLHLAESPQDRYQSGMTSISYLASIGFLGPEVLAGHCVQADSGDIGVLKAFDVKVATNAVSNMFLGSGIAPVAEMQAAGITVGLGTDDANCNNSVNMISDMKIAALAQKSRYGRAAAITAERVLEMATIDGARALGMAGQIGSLEVGKKADLVLLDFARPHLYPRHSVASAIVYQANGSEVDTVIVDGRVLVRGGVLAGLGAGRTALLADAVQQASARVAQQACLTDYPSRGWRSGPAAG
jgi:atrazine chlorohydrolase/5-methylthioadenosine/S-adenosylhomocysteine deaminase/melamine deaminase